MAKHHKGNKTPAAQHTNTAQSAVASAWQKATTGIGAIASLVQSDVSVVTLPNLDNDQVTALDKAEQNHAKRSAAIQAEVEALEKRLQAEEVRWDKEKERLQAALRRARG